MKKSILILVFLSLLSINHSGQVFNKKNLDLNLGIGIGFNLYAGDYIEGIPPLSVSFDYGLSDLYGPGVIGIGGMAGFTTFKDIHVREIPGVMEESGHKYSALFLGIKTSYHMELLKKLDTYANLALYYVNLDTKPYGTWEPENDIKSKVNAALVVGSKYFFTEKLAVYAEAGYSSSWLTLGVSFRL